MPSPHIENKAREIFQYSKGDYTLMEDEAKSMNWNLILGKGSLEIKWTNFKAKYNELNHKYVPQKTIGTCK